MTFARRVLAGVPFAIALVTASALADAPAPPVADHVVDVSDRAAEACKAARVPALALAWIDGGQVVATGAAGVRKQGDPTPVTIDDRWHLGSCTKAMTATLAGVLVERGLIAWDTTIAHSMPEIAGDINPAYTDVTLLQLLSHRSGLPEDRAPDAAQMALWNAMRSAGDTLAERRAFAVRMGLKQPPKSAPGEKFAYSNIGYAVAGAMLEHAAGKPYETLMQDDIFAPLGITTAGWGAPGEKGKLTEPCGHAAGVLGLTPVTLDSPVTDNPDAIAPGATCHMSIADWGRFIAAHAREGRDGLLASPATFKTLHTALGDDYACGWIVTARPWAGDGPVLNHAGTNGLWFAIAWVAPAKDSAYIAVCNAGGNAAAAACDQVITTLILDPPALAAPNAP